MKTPPPPLRFLMLVGGIWIAARAISLLPTPSETTVEPLVAARPAGPAPAVMLAERNPGERIDPVVQAEAASPASTPLPTHFRRSHSLARSSTIFPHFSPQTPTDPPRTSPFTTQSLASPPRRQPDQPLSTALRAVAPNPVTGSRWSGSAWLFVRGGNGGGTLAPGGTLGGSQAGARLTYRLNRDVRRPLGVSARLYTPLDNLRGAEAAIGLDWRPFASLPVNLLAERRQRLGRDGRSDFALTVYGGAETRIAADRVRIAGYAQAGVVGLEARDLFADGSLVATIRVGPFELGGGAWGGAQPGVARLDLGPHASFTLPVGRTTLRAAAEWRFRVAGDAAPDSGPALTISAGF